MDASSNRIANAWAGQDHVYSACDMRVADDGEGRGVVPVKYWVRATNIPKYESAFQKVRESHPRPG